MPGVQASWELTVKHTFQIVLTVSLLASASVPVRAQTAPPTLQKLTPTGAQRGTQVTITITGTNIGDATRLIFSEPGFSSRITSVKEVPIEKMVVPKGVVRTDAPIDDKARKFELDRARHRREGRSAWHSWLPAAHAARRVQSAALRGELAC